MPRKGIIPLLEEAKVAPVVAPKGSRLMVGASMIAVVLN